MDIKAMFLMMAPDLPVNAIAITELPLPSEQLADLIVIGGGAAGFMGAITAAENSSCSVFILESTKKCLEKVRISGGGRCNVTHACWDPRELVENYPRGSRPLLSSFSRFAPGDAVAWFSDRGVDLVAELDGRMFPVANTSNVVVDCLRSCAKAVGVTVITRSAVNNITSLDNQRFLIHHRERTIFRSKKVLLATGGNPSGRNIAATLGHTIVPPVPSLFTFKIGFPWTISCSGLSVDNVQLELKVNGKSFRQFGRVLFTHWGLSGPAVLRLSAFAARELSRNNYQGSLFIKWLHLDEEELIASFNNLRSKHAKKTMASIRPCMQLPKRLWLSFLEEATIDSNTRCSDLSSKEQRTLIHSLLYSSYCIEGRGRFGEEFVTAGGIELAEVDLATMQSRLCPGLYFAGEILDIDGVTGGFNFQHCWTSGWLAGRDISNVFSNSC